MVEATRKKNKSSNFEERKLYYGKHGLGRTRMSWEFSISFIILTNASFMLVLAALNLFSVAWPIVMQIHTVLKLTYGSHRLMMSLATTNLIVLCSCGTLPVVS